ncbi:MAG: ABC transporter ATP-binding protein [Pseudomonadota bacterium]
MSDHTPVLELTDVTRRFGTLTIFEKINFSLMAGQTVALLGPSGSGKSSLLHIAGLLEAPTAGDVIVNGRATGALPDRERTLIRRDEIGFVYQFHHLLPEFNALGNVALPQLIAGQSKSAAEDEAARLLSLMGLGERLHHQPGELSGGEQQRTAIARALANRPKILLADEPTGNLDTQTSDEVFAALLDLVKSEGLAALIATHDRDLAKRMDLTVSIDQGVLVAAAA